MVRSISAEAEHRDIDLSPTLVTLIAEGHQGSDHADYSVLSKALRVLGHAELFEPFRYLLRRRCVGAVPAPAAIKFGMDPRTTSGSHRPFRRTVSGGWGSLDFEKQPHAK